MGLFSSKKTRKVPDLSRYDSHYENLSRANSLSSDAAAAALRTYSLNSNNSFYHQSYQNQSLRNNSLRNNSSRANSLRNNYNLNNSSRNGYRSNSLTNSYQRTDSFQNPIIIHTTKTEDEFGRTKSITTETIQQFGSFEIVKREIQEISQPRPLYITGNGNTRHLQPAINLSNYAESLMSNNNNELASIREEIEEEEPNGGYYFASFSGNGISDQPQSPKRSPIQIKPIRSILKENGNNTTHGASGENSDNESIYSDAYDMMPGEKDVRFKTVKLDQPERRSSITSSVNSAKPKKRALTEAEMYAKAMEIAKQKVYGGESKAPSMDLENRSTGFRSYSLREGKGPQMTPKQAGKSLQLQQQQLQKQHQFNSSSSSIVNQDVRSKKKKFSIKKFFQIFSDPK